MHMLFFLFFYENARTIQLPLLLSGICFHFSLTTRWMIQDRDFVIVERIQEKDGGGSVCGRDENGSD